MCCRPGGIGPRIINVTTDEIFCNEDDESTHPLCNGKPNMPMERPKPPQDFVPKCGRYFRVNYLMPSVLFSSTRHNPDGYQQSLVNLDEALHESQFAEWPNMCAVIIKVFFFVFIQVSDMVLECICLWCFTNFSKFCYFCSSLL